MQFRRSTETYLDVAPGVRLAVDILGPEAGRPVVLLHGGGQTRHAWGGTAELMAARGWHVVSADLRGHGDSSRAPNAEYMIDHFAQDIRVIASTFAEPPALIGASMGGLASLVAVGESATRIASCLVLVDVAPQIEPEGEARVLSFMNRHLNGFASLQEVAAAIAEYNPGRPPPHDLEGLKKVVRRGEDGRWRWHWDPLLMRSILHESGRLGIVAPRLDLAAAAICVPTLVVRGRESDVLSEAGVNHLLGLIPHARVAEVVGARHMVAGDRNDVFNREVIAFLETVHSPEARSDV